MQAAIGSHWSFFQWEIDNLGLFPKAIRSRKFIIVVVDHFNKWVEAETV